MKVKLNVKIYSDEVIVEGQTFYVKEKLKQMGFRWEPKMKFWYIKTNKGDELLKKFSEFAHVKVVYDYAKEEKFNNLLVRFFGNLQYLTVQRNEVEGIEDVLKRLKKITTRYFELFYYTHSIKTQGELSRYYPYLFYNFYIIYDEVKDIYYINRDDKCLHMFDAYVGTAEIEKFLKEIENEELVMEEASRRLEGFIKAKYIDVETAEKIKREIEEKKKRIKKETSIMSEEEKERQLEELFKKLNDKEAYLIQDYDLSHVSLLYLYDGPFIYRGAYLWKNENKYIITTNVTDRRNAYIYVVRDNSGKIKEFLDNLLGKPILPKKEGPQEFGNGLINNLSELQKEIEKYLKENYNYKEFNYRIEPYVELDYLFSGEEEEMHIIGVFVRGYTNMIEDILKDLGFFKPKDPKKYGLLLDGTTWIKLNMNDMSELIKKIPKNIKIISPRGS